MKTLVDVHRRRNASQSGGSYYGEYTETNVSQYMSDSAYDDFVTAGTSANTAVAAAKAACECAAEAKKSEDVAAASAASAADSAEVSKKAAEWAAELSKDFGQVETDLAEMKVLKDETVINAGHAAESANNAAESAIAAGLSEDSAKASELKAKEYLDQFLEGSIYGGVWNVATGAYPEEPTISTTWDVSLPADEQQYEFDNKIWHPGDKLVYTVKDAAFHQISNPQGGVFSVNGKKGVVVLDSTTMTSVSLVGSDYDDLFHAKYGVLATGIYIKKINGSNLKNHDPVIAVTGDVDYEATISITNDAGCYTMRVSLTTYGAWDHQGRESVMSGITFEKAKENGWESTKFLKDPEHIRVNSHTVTDLSFSRGFVVTNDPDNELVTIKSNLTSLDVGALSAKAGTLTGLTDWDTALIPGSWKVSNVNSAAPNKPPTSDVKDGICLVQMTDSVTTQTYIPADVNNKTGLFIRSSVSGLFWTAWASVGESAVSSVNGKEGAVVLAAADVGAIPSSMLSTTGGWANVQNKVVNVRNDGVASIGKYLDFYEQDDAPTDYKRITRTGTSIDVQATLLENGQRVYSPNNKPPVPYATSGSVGGFRFSFSSGTLNLYSR